MPIMIQRLRELQTETAQDLPQVETVQTSTAEQQDKTEGEDLGEEEGGSSHSAAKNTSKPLTQLSVALKNGSGGSSSTRLLPDFVYQASPDAARRETEDKTGGGGKKRTMKENGRKAKQKVHSPSSSSCRTEEEVDRRDDSRQQASSSSWSAMSSMVIGSDYCLSPLSPAMEQRLILQYLTPLGDYQEVRVQTQLVPSL